jgi:hypothetical protein
MLSVLLRCTDSYYLFDIFRTEDIKEVIGIPTSKKNRRYQRDNGNPYIEEEQKISKR